MDDARFDALTQRFGRAATRRHAVWGALGGVGAGLLTLREPDVAKARKKKKKKKCKSSQKKCGNTCISKSACCGGCGADTCCNGTCIPATDCCGGCGSAETCCKGTCVDLATDAANCAECGKACLSNACINGVCTCDGVPQCPGPCTCATREVGTGNACFLTITAQTCNTDAECGLGKACLSNNKCATACPPA